MKKSLLNTPPDSTPDTTVTVNGIEVPAHSGEWLIETLNRHADSANSKRVPQVCYLPQMGPIESCDTCMVEVNGKLDPRLRHAGRGRDGREHRKSRRPTLPSARPSTASSQNHELYCTVCDNNNQNCTIHNTTADLDVKHQARPYPAQAVSAGPLQSLLSLRSRPVHPVRAVRGGLPECAGQRDADDRLGVGASARSVGWRRED